MNNKFIEYILKNKSCCYFISPHIDDAAFSAGSLLLSLSGKVPLTIINVFTQAANGPQTLSAKRYLHKTGISTPNQYFATRSKEDTVAFKNLQIKIINLGLTESLWRKKQGYNSDNIFYKIIPELCHLYPTYWHTISGRVHTQDQNLVDHLSQKITSIIKNSSNNLTLCPHAYGNHVDHIITRLAVEKFTLPIYWLDQPYYLHFGNKHIPPNQELIEVYKCKIQLVNMYPSQTILAKWIDKLASTPDKYIIPKYL